MLMAAKAALMPGVGIGDGCIICPCCGIASPPPGIVAQFLNEIALLIGVGLYGAEMVVMEVADGGHIV